MEQKKTTDLTTNMEGEYQKQRSPSDLHIGAVTQTHTHCNVHTTVNNDNGNVIFMHKNKFRITKMLSPTLLQNSLDARPLSIFPSMHKSPLNHLTKSPHHMFVQNSGDIRTKTAQIELTVHILH